MPVATALDASNRLGRPLTTDETASINAYLADAEAEIIRRIPDAVAAADSDAHFKQRLVAVECGAALRAARLPVGVDLVQPEAGSITFNPASQAGYVQILRREWRMLGVANVAAVRVTPGLDTLRENYPYLGDECTWT